MKTTSQKTTTGKAGRAQRALRISSNTIRLSGNRLVHYPRGTSARDAFAYISLPACAVNHCDVENVPAVPYVSPWGEDRAILARLDVAKIEETAGRIAGSRARFYFLGGARKGKLITRGKNKGKFRGLQAREGCGIPLDMQAIEELRGAARAELIACAIEGIEEREAFRRARNAAQKLMHNSTREMIYSDPSQAQAAHDRAFTRAREAWDAETLPANESQPFWGEQSGCATRADLARQLRATRDAIRAYWRASASPYARQGMRLDFALSRELLRLSESGSLSIKNGDAMRKRCDRLAQRVQAGRAMIAPKAAARETRPAVTATRPQACPVVSLPITRAEFLADFCNRDSYVRKLINSQRATRADLEQLAFALGKVS